jgi:hypothetical protein
VIGLDATLKQRLVTNVSNALDMALLTSDGSNDSIVGLSYRPQVQTAALDVTDADSLLDAIALASAAEVTPNRWFINGQHFIALRKLKDGNCATSSSPASRRTSPTACSAFRSPSRTSSSRAPRCCVIRA